jgi:hypothetical protein
MEESFLVQRIKAVTILFWAFTSFYAMFTAPKELQKIAKVQNYQAVQLYIERIETFSNSLTEPKAIKAIILYDAKTNHLIKVRHLVPGGINNPGYLVLLGPKFQLSKKIYEKTHIEVYRSPDGREYYIERGNYIMWGAILSLAILFWLTMLIRIFLAYRKGKK